MLVAMAFAFVSGAALAQASSDAAGVPTPPGGVAMGPLTAYPSVTYDVQRNSNIFLQAPNSGLVKSDIIQSVKPAVRLEGKQGANVYAFGIGADLGRYSSSTADNYTDNNAFASANLNPDARVRMRLNANYVDAHDPRGSTTDPFTQTPNRYRQQTLGGIFGYGAPGAQGRVELELGGLNKHYTNNRTTTAINDRSDNILGGTFFWRIAPRTSLLAQVKRTGVDYTDPSATLDSTEMRYLGGVTWEATAATTGIFKIGQVKKDFKDSNRPDFTGTNWEAQIQWSPLTYSKWDFITSKTPRETAGNFGDFVLATSYLARWTHAWTSQFSTIATGSYATDDYKGAGRNDKLTALGLKGTYQMRRWLSFGASYDWSNRDSNIDTADYKKNVILLFVNATL